MTCADSASERGATPQPEAAPMQRTLSFATTATTGSPRSLAAKTGDGVEESTAGLAGVESTAAFEPAPSQDRLLAYVREHKPATPVLVLDVPMVEATYRRMSSLLPPRSHIFYAVKACPEPAVLRALIRMGSSFDTASRGELSLLESLGVDLASGRASFGNTIKKEADIAWAFQKGVRLFAFDSDEELEKLARSAPGSRVFCRLLVNCPGAEWPLSRKFGCEQSMAKRLMLRARALGLEPYGLSFHVGSQQTSLVQWTNSLQPVAQLIRELKAEGMKLPMVNLGGGFPGHYVSPVKGLAAYCAAVRSALTDHFAPPEECPLGWHSCKDSVEAGASFAAQSAVARCVADAPLELVFEPGRSMVADAGVLATEVVLVSRKADGDGAAGPRSEAPTWGPEADEEGSAAGRWVYLDIGKFGGLQETLDESIRYRLLTSRDGDGSGTGPAILAGPTCDSADIMYEKKRVHLPRSLTSGDTVIILSTGCYTTSLSAVGFNGFDPLRCEVLL